MAKVLLEDGFDVTVLEQAGAIGGIWREGGAYAGLHNQSVHGLFEFADLPSGLHMASAADTCRYLETYAATFGVTDRVRLSTPVQALRRTPRGTWAVTTPDGSSDFDVAIVASGAHTHPYLPTIPDRDRFEGLVLHSNEVVRPSLIEARRVVVVGGGKSAIDMSLLAARHGASSTVVSRRINWFVPERILFGRVTYDRVLLTRLGEALLPVYHGSAVVRLPDRLPAGVKRQLWRLIGWDLLRSGGLHRLPDHLRPKGELPIALAHTGVMPLDYARAVSAGQIDVRVSTVRSFSPRGVLLADGEEIGADVVVFATGHRKVFPFLDPEIRIHDDRGRLRLYRGLVVPGIPNLGFIGLRQIFNNVLGMEISAHWLADYVAGRLPAMPSEGEMNVAIDARLDWQERVLPGSMGYDFAAYDIHVVDELLHDMGLSTRRSKSRLAEYLLPAAIGRRYAGLSAERARRPTSVFQPRLPEGGTVSTDAE
jgi:dimethylaniline monooxygenase (N-oxide forming)